MAGGEHSVSPRSRACRPTAAQGCCLYRLGNLVIVAQSALAFHTPGAHFREAGGGDAHGGGDGGAPAESWAGSFCTV